MVRPPLRAAVWQRLVKELNYHEDAHSLQTQWKRLRERYVRERRRKAAKDFFDPLTGGVSSVKNFHLMHWIDEFLPDISNNQSSSSNSSNNVSMHLPGTSISDRQQHQQQQYFEPLNNGFGNIGICKSSLNGPSTSTIGTKKNESTNGSPSSTSSETSTISGGGGQQQQIILPNLRHQIKSEINGGSAFYSTGKANQLMYKLREELGLRMPPVIGLVNNIGQEQQHQQHLNISPHQLQMPTETLRPISAECYQQIGILPQQQHSIQDIQNDYFHQQQQPSSSSSATNEAAISSPYLNRRKRSALDSLMLLQQQQSTNNERILQRNNNSRTKQEQQQQQIIAESEHLLIQQQQQQQIPSIALAIHNNQQQQQHHLLSPHQAPSVHSIRSSNSNSSTSLQQQQNNLLLPSTSSTITVGQQQQQASSSTTNTTIIPQQQQQQLFQQQEEIVENEEGNFIEMIVRHLKNLNEDEKVVTKMNIQRILMDARFGRGACVRMFNDELAMEQQRQQQQHLQQ
ncbi:unnamed protein product [Meloidogyne enterolobii]|uniref:Uncharacterized protein n=1 Tax=Meloidogyne enterolobii TaxID=390850 RepID=A0ACB1AN37_MELEN